MGTLRSRRSATHWTVVGLTTTLGIAVLLAMGRSHAQGPPAAVPPQGPDLRASSSFRPDDSYTAETLLRNAARQVAQGQWPEAIDLYQKVIREHGESLALVPQADADGKPVGSSLYVDARRYCQGRIAGLPPEARAIYRQRVDDEAGDLFRRGDESLDPAPLRRVVDEFFCSDWGDDAAQRLGDLAFRAGRFGEALSAYRMLVPGRDGGVGESLVHPDPSVDLAAVAARALLCRAALGDAPAEADLADFRARFPDAKGHLAGRDGPMAELVARAVGEDHLAPPASIEERWPTFAGSPSRSKVADEPIEIGDFQWSLPLDEPTDEPDQGMVGFRGLPTPPSSGAGDAALAYYPIVVGDQVVVSDGSKILSLRLDAHAEATVAADELLDKLRVWEQPPDHPARRARGTSGPAHYTLTAHRDRIYARLSTSLNRGGGNGGTIVAIRNNHEVEGKLLWYLSAGEISLPERRGGLNDRASPTFEGTPVADDRRVYVALTEAATETWVYVAALDADNGEVEWVTYLGNSASSRDLMRNQMLGSAIGHRLLSLDGQNVYYQTNMGAVAALDAETGDVRWLATYPTPDVQGGGPSAPRDVNPAVVHDGLVIVAPEDAAELFAFDAGTGRLAWKTQAMPDVIHLLGVARGNLFATGRHRVYTIEAKTGKVVRFWPDAGLGYEGYGRGILAGDRVYWPTRTEIHVLDQATGGNEHATIPLFQAFGHYGGNLAVGDGYLVVAERNRLVVYCQNTRLLERLQEQIVEHPDRAADHYQLARLAESVDRPELALSSLERAIALAGGSDLVNGRPLAEVARSRRYGLLMKLGDAAIEASRWDEAVSRFGDAVAAGQSDREQIQARLALASAEESAGRLAESVANLQSLINHPGLDELSLAADERRVVRADGLVADRLVAMVRRHGRGLYAPYDREAEALLRRGREEKDPRALREVGRSYPAAEVASEALLALGRLSEELGRPAEAASAYKRLLAIAPEPALRARALWGLAEAYEAQGYLGPARDTFTRARARYPEVVLTPFGIEGKVGDLTAARLGSPQLSAIGGARGEPLLPVPLVRLHSSRFESEVRPLAAEGYPNSPRAARIFLASGTTLRPIDPISGESPWTADLGGEPRWVGYLADRILAATPTRLFALATDDGHELWNYDPRGSRQEPNPFDRPGPDARPDPPRDPETLGMLNGFRLVGPRVVFLRGDRELLALEAESGRIDWSYAPAGGAIDRHLLATPSRVFLQAGEPRAVVVLDSETGRPRGEFPRDAVEPPWERDPVALDDDRVAVALDERRVALFDLERGVEVWTYRDATALPLQVPPMLLADSGRLLALFGGNRLVRLDPDNGTPIWEQPIGPGDLSDDPGSFALDAERIYLARGVEDGGELAALSLDKGARIWSRHLAGPEGGWSVALGERCVAAYPEPARSMAGPLDSLPILFCRRDSGTPVQRLNFAAPVRDLAVRLDARATLVATQDHLWSLGASTDSDDRTP